jgi:hypothetical protein
LKFPLNFIEGAGETDGAILETLSSVLDEVAGLTQAMSVCLSGKIPQIVPQIPYNLRLKSPILDDKNFF